MSPRQKKQPNKIDEGKKAMSQENQQEGQAEEKTLKGAKNASSSIFLLMLSNGSTT